MSKPRKLLPITEYLMEHVYDKMWHDKNPERYLDRVLRKWFGDMKWNTRHNEMVELDENKLDDLISLKLSQMLVNNEKDRLGYTKSKIISEAICSKFGQRQTEDIYIANGVDNPVKFTNHSADDNYPLATPIKQHAGKIEYASEDVGELVGAAQELLLEYSARRKAEWGNRYEKDELELSAEQAIAKFKERYK